MSFDRKRCTHKKIWCGKGPIPHGDEYLRAGTPFECLQQGFGAGKYSEKDKHLPFDSLQKIKYVGETHEKAFIKAKIPNLTKLLEFAKKYPSKLEDKLRDVLTKKDGKVDIRAFNHILLWLDDHQVSKLPRCILEDY